MSLRAYNFQDLVGPSWELVIEQIEIVAKEELLSMKQKVYERAKEHFFTVLVGPRRWKFIGPNSNPYGQKLTKKFIDICISFRKTGTVENHGVNELRRVLRAIYRNYISESDVMSKNVQKMSNES